MKLNLAAFGACIAKIVERGRMTDGEAKAILQEVANRAEQMRASGVADPFVSAAAEMAGRLKENAQKAHADGIRNALIRNNLLGEIEKQGGLANAPETIRSLLHGTNKGSRDNIQSQWRGLAANWQAVLSNALRRGGLEHAAITGELDNEVAEALWRAHGGKPNDDVKISQPAQKIADAIKPLQDNARDRLNNAGAQIGDAMDYVAHQEHDPRKMRRAAGPGQTPDAAFGAWWQAEQPRWSEKTFDGLVPREGESDADARTRFARSVFDALVSGVHMTASGAKGLETDGAGFVAPAFEGSRNIAKKLGQPRVIRYKDAQSWLDHQQQFGSATSLTAGVMRTLDQSARQVALMEKLGTNPTANLNQVLRKVEETYRSDLDGLKSFQGKIAGIKNVMGRLDGSLNIPENEMAAKIGANIRTFETMGSLGGVGVTHFASIWPTVTSELVHHGVSRLQTLGNMVQALVRGKGTAERQDILADLGAYAGGLSRDMFARWQPEDSVPGRISSIANTFMKYTGIHYIFDNTQAGVREMLAHQLGRSTGKEFGALDPHLSQMLGKYNIVSDEWNLLRGVPDLPVSEGRAYLTPSDARRIDPAQTEALLRSRGMIGEKSDPASVQQAVSQFGQTLSDRLLSYYGDAADHAVVTPGVKERALLLGSTRPGSIGGELLRFVTQFKMWPLAAMSQVIGREIYMSLSAKEAVWNLGALAALSSAFGYLRMSVNDAALGHPVRNPLDPKTMLAGLAQGGGIGILGDFLFGETSRMGGGLVSTAMGPVASDADQLIQIFNRFRADLTDPTIHHKNGKFADLWPDLAHFGVRHVPFSNLVYLKGALDYLAWYHLYEAASPGWWERTNRRLEKDQGRAMTGYVPGGGVPVGVPGVYMKNNSGQTFGLLGGLGTVH
jgi:hypothetical protein